MLQTIIILIILASSFPIGYLLAYLTKEELVSGRKYFVMLAFIALSACLPTAFINFDLRLKLSIILALLYVAVISFISVWKSYDKKFAG